LKKLTLILMVLIILTTYPSITESKEIGQSNIRLNLPSLYDIKIETLIDNKTQFITLENVGITEYEAKLISMICQMEAEGETIFGNRLVVYTILNRLHNKQTWWGYDIESLIVNPSQFNGVTNPRFGYYSEETYVTVLDAIYRYYSGELKEKYYGILYFNGLNKIESRAYIDRYSLYLIVSEGGHRFYGEEK